MRTMRRHALRSRLWIWNVANGECEISHARQHSNMLILSHTVAYGGVLPFAFASGDGECLAGGLLEFDVTSVSIGVVLCRRRVVVCSFLQSTKLGGQCYWAMGFCAKTV